MKITMKKENDGLISVGNVTSGQVVIDKCDILWLVGGLSAGRTRKQLFSIKDGSDTDVPISERVKLIKGGFVEDNE